MPKIGMEPLRRHALIEATIAEVGRSGSLDVPVSRIARRAGVSPALAHHYFGSKDALVIAAMRRILDAFGASVRARYRDAAGPRARLDAVIGASFGPDQFEPTVVVAWLTFYVQAQRSPQARRLLSVYARRLESNLVHALRQLVPPARARAIAQGVGAMIDGVYIRAALGFGPDRAAAIAMTAAYLDLCLSETEA